ncbi:MAG: bifunctional diguanylate cyclase/phosphodiesterase [Azonexus sp.]|nr:bifunctional diguanylate cyclase/phosphodiesterase [Azonexus sp.]
MTDCPKPPWKAIDRSGCAPIEIRTAAVDPGSGFLKRCDGLNAATRLLAEASRLSTSLAALWLDVDRFRQVNDSFGHAGGDRLIACIAGRIRQAVSGLGECLHMGSDEFVILIPDAGRSSAEQSARKLLLEIEQPMAIDDIMIRPSVSIGIAISLADDDPIGLLERADRAMIDAKRQGGNRFVISGYEALPGRIGVALAREELAIESALYSALENGELRLNYQPIIRPDGRVEAVEALMRCAAQGVQIPPDKFIPVAEKTGLIVRLGEWSLLQGTRCAARLREQGYTTKVAINVSRVQLLSPGFLPALHGALICANVPPELIELELTESLVMDLSPTVQANLRSARQAGVGLAIDDFGTGYSSLASLKDIPATKLKFDRAFISVLPADRQALAIVKAMTQLGRELGMIVIAEGVETHEQLIACEVAGTDATQGFFHARPMSEDDLILWMKGRSFK